MNTHTWLMKAGATAGALVLACGALAADPDTTETWDAGLEGWVRWDPLNSRNPTMTNPGGRVQIKFGKQSWSFPEVHLVQATTNASNGSFFGDYWNTAITNVGFSLYCATHAPADLRLYFFSESSQNWWYYPLGSAAVGQWTRYEVPVDLPQGWRLGTGASFASFKADLKNVTWIGIQVQRDPDIARQTYEFDDFTINGASPSTDSDTDGMSDWAEFIAGTAANDPDSVLVMDVAVTNSPDGTIVSWQSVGNRTYGIGRTTNLLEAFEKIETGVTATPPLNTYMDGGATGRGPYFYQIQVED